MSLHPKGKCIIVLLVYSLYSDSNNNALFIVLLFYSIVSEFYYCDNNGVFVQQIRCAVDWRYNDPPLLSQLISILLPSVFPVVGSVLCTCRVISGANTSVCHVLPSFPPQ